MATTAGADPILENHPRYRKVKDINRGSYGFVVLAVDNHTNEQVAIKFIKRGNLISRFVEKEVMNLRRLDHYHIISFRRVFVTEKYLGIVTEFANMGNLHEYIRDLGRGLDEQEARWYFQQLTMAIDYCHRMGVANRDIKLENTLLSHNPSQGLLPIVKLCDFGFSKDVNRDSVADTKVGTLDYFAPEVLDLRQGETYDATQADMWSLGVTLYAMLCRGYPYRRRDDNPTTNQYQFVRTMLDRIKAGDINPLPNGVSEGCRTLLMRLLEVDPGKRYKVEDLCQDAWFRIDLPARAEQILLAPRSTPPVVEPLPGCQSEEDVRAVLTRARLDDGSLDPEAPSDRGGVHNALGRAFESAGRVVAGSAALQQVLGKGLLAGQGGATGTVRDAEAQLATLRAALDDVATALAQVV